MHRTFHQFWTHDQTQFNWLTRVIDKDGDGYGVRFGFIGAFCPKCSRFDEDAVLLIAESSIRRFTAHQSQPVPYASVWDITEAFVSKGRSGCRQKN